MQTEAKVGLAVVLGAALLVMLLGKVERWSGTEQAGMELTARFDTVSGLEPRSPVQVAGVQVGEVTTISLVNGQAEVGIRLYPQVVIHSGAEASIRSSGLLGEKFLELQPGNQSLAPLAPGAQVPQQEGSADLDRLIGQFNGIATDLRAVASAVRELVATKESRARLNGILDNAHGFSESLGHEGPEILAKLNEIVDKINSGSGTAGKLVNDTAVYDDLHVIMTDVRELVAKVKRGEGSLGKLISDPTLYDKLQGAAEGVESITAQVSSGEGSLGKLLNDSSTIESFNAAMDSMGQMGERLTRLRTFITFRNEYQFDTSVNKGYFSLLLAPGSERSYVIEVVNDPGGRVQETVTETTVNGVTLLETEIRTDRRLLLSALFDQHFGKWGVRGGLMESTFGLGLDYNGWKHWTVLLDTWDFDSVRPNHTSPHIKTTARYQWGDYFFAQGGMDNILNSDYFSPFLGVGLTFEDEDIKYLLGAAASALN